MTRYGYHASHEQYPPGELLRLVQAAEEAGFASMMCSDHIAPWSMRQGQSGFAWSWLGAALQATGLDSGVVTSPVGRYNPAIIAQAAATLAEMYPGRFWMAVGSGLFSNEHITGEAWPPKEQRNERLHAAVDVIRRLWRGETVTVEGDIQLSHARLYTLPETPPLLFGAALSPETAAFVGSWADGLITVHQTRDELQAVIDAFRQGGGEGKPMFIQSQISWAADEDQALEGAYDQWRNNVFPSAVLTDVRLPEDFDAAGEYVTREELGSRIRISADLDQHARWLGEYAELGFDEVLIHNVNRDQDAFMRAFGEHVLPALRQKASVA